MFRSFALETMIKMGTFGEEALLELKVCSSIIQACFQNNLQMRSGFSDA